MGEQTDARPRAARLRTGKSRSPRWRTILAWSVMSVSLVLFTLALWIRYRFGAVGFEAIVTNLPIGKGWTIGNRDLFDQALIVCLGLPAVVIIAAAALRAVVHRRQRTWPTARYRGPISAVAFAVSLGILLSVAGVPHYAVARLSGQSFAPYYVRPHVSSAPEHPRNLITIYMESMENSFRDADTFGENLLAPLDRATRDWTHFDELHLYPGGGWTMAGLVSTQCGIPLRSAVLHPGIDMNIAGEAMSHYLPGATCLGDILADNGYTNHFLGGADSHFAGKDTFLFDHGFMQVMGRDDWEAAGTDPDLMSDWGLSDRELFDHARDTLAALREKDEPYHLSILTLDTHEPAGIFPTCQPEREEVAMATAIKCSMSAVGGFLDDLASSGVLDDTVVVVMGDHLKGTAPGDDFRAELTSYGERTIVLAMSSPDPITIARTERVDQLSMLPTILELLGFQVPDGRAGLGVSFVGEHDLTDTALELPPTRYDEVVRAPSVSLYRSLWSGTHS